MMIFADGPSVRLRQNLTHNGIFRDVSFQISGKRPEKKLYCGIFVRGRFKVVRVPKCRDLYKKNYVFSSNPKDSSRRSNVGQSYDFKSATQFKMTTERVVQREIL